MDYNTFKVDNHKLKIEDIDRTDQQNWGSTQCIASRHVQRCLKEMRSTTSGRVERTLGTEIYLMIVADYIDIFMSHSLTLWEKCEMLQEFNIFSCYGYVGREKNLILMPT